MPTKHPSKSPRSRKANSKRPTALSAWPLARFSECPIRSSSWATAASSSALALHQYQIPRRARQWTPDRIEHRHALGIVRLLRPADRAARVLGPRRGAAPARSTMTIFDRWGVRRTGLFTFAQSPKHVGLYQKYGYWPGYLTALMTRAPEADATNKPPPCSPDSRRPSASGPSKPARSCTNKIDKGLDLSDEIRSVLKQRAGDVVLTQTRGALDGFAVCLTGPGSEGGEKLCYIKFGAAGPVPARTNALTSCSKPAKPSPPRAERRRSRNESGPRRGLPADEGPRLSRNHAGRLDAAPARGGIQPRRRLGDRRLA